MTFLTMDRQQIAMPQVMPAWSETMNLRQSQRRRKFLKRVLELSLSALVFLVAPAILGGKDLHAQTHAPHAAESAQQKAAAKPALPAAPAPEAAGAQLPLLPTPTRPVDQPANQARVTRDSRGLEIEASNSSLNQILQQVAVETGAKLEGLTQDQRVFGKYGPGPESDVLLKLLDGSGYNVLIIGGGDTDARLEIVLSTRSSASPQTATSIQNRRNSDRVESEPRPVYPPEPLSPQSAQNPFGNGDPQRDPLQFMQEILQRQQKIDQQQQEYKGQQNNPQ